MVASRSACKPERDCCRHGLKWLSCRQNYAQLCACQCCPAAAPGAELLQVFSEPSCPHLYLCCAGTCGCCESRGRPLGCCLGSQQIIILPAPSLAPSAPPLPPRAPSLNASCADHACSHCFAVWPLRCWPPSCQPHRPLHVSPDVSPDGSELLHLPVKPHPTPPRSTFPSLCSWDKKFKPYTLEYAKNEDKVGSRGCGARGWVGKQFWVAGWVGEQVR